MYGLLVMADNHCLQFTWPLQTKGSSLVGLEQDIEGGYQELGLLQAAIPAIVTSLHAGSRKCA